MTGWYKSKTKKVDLEKFGAPELYVAFQDVSSLPYGDARALQKRISSLDAENPDEGQATQVLSEIIGLILEWNITDPQTGEAIPKPTKPEDFDVLPMEVLMYLLEQSFGGEESPLAKENESKPSQP